MYFAYFIIPALCMVPIGIYFYYYFKRAAAIFKVDTGRRAIRLLLALSSAVFVGFAMNIWGFWAVVVLYLFMFAIIMELLNILVLKAIQVKRHKYWDKIYASGVIPLVFTVIALGYGYMNMRNVVEKDYTVYTDKEIREEGYRVALVSDLHYGITLDKSQLEDKCAEIEAAQPDLVVLCGDIFDERTSKIQMEEAVRIFGSIQSEFGTIYIYGNHDQASFSDKPNYTVQHLQQTILSENIRILQDEQWQLNDEFVVIGRDDRRNPSGGERKSSRELAEGADPEDFLLLLNHQPCELVENSEAGYDLQLSGHTHGGQIWPMGFLNEYMGFGEINYGHRAIDGFQVIVSSGMAGWGYPVRIGSHSEYVIVDILNN